MAEIKKKARSTAKGQLTKQSRQVLRYVHEKEEEEVQMRLDALKVGFVALSKLIMSTSQLLTILLPKKMNHIMTMSSRNICLL